MHYYALLRTLLACFFLYIAWPYFMRASSSVEMLFWGVWLLLLLFVLGANLATLLQVTKPPIIEQERKKIRKTHKH